MLGEARDIIDTSSDEAEAWSDRRPVAVARAGVGVIGRAVRVVLVICKCGVYVVVASKVR